MMIWPKVIIGYMPTILLVWMVKLSLSHIPSYVYVRPGYREKSADLQGNVKVHLRFYDRISRLHSENWHAHYSLHACRCLQMHPCLKGNLRET